MDDPTPNDTPTSRWQSVQRWSKTNPYAAVVAVVCFVVGPATLALCGIGWAAALKRERAATATEQRIQSELRRSLSAEQSLEARIAEAAKARDALDIAKLAEVEERTRIEADNKRLRVSITAAEQALQKSRDAMDGPEREPVVNPAARAELLSLVKNLEGSLVASSTPSETNPASDEIPLSTEQDELPEPANQ